MDKHIRLISSITAGLLLAACGQQDSPGGAGAPAAKAAAAPASSEFVALKAENERLQADVKALRAQVEELKLTPQVLLARLTMALTQDKAADAKRDIDALEQRFAGSEQVKVAKAALARYEAMVAAREDLAKAVEAKGFYALPTNRSPKTGDLTLRVESLQFGNRWSFDAYDDESFYREAERGQKFVLLRTTVDSKDKNPRLPDVGVYRIEGKKMIRVAQMRYEFRRWTSHGTYIGLYHDFRNDFSRTSAIPFNAAASISDDDAKAPIAVVFTGQNCHERGDKIGQPEVVYRLHHSCATKAELETNDFNEGAYRVIAFFNRPKGI